MKKHLTQLALAAGAMLALGVAIPAGSATAADFWVASGVGNWYVAANWNAGVPSGATDAQINNGGTAQLFDAGATANTMTLGNASGNNGALEVFGGSAIFGSSISVGSSGTGALRVLNRGGLVSWSGSLGSSSGATGTATVDGVASTWTVYTGQLIVGDAGTGTLNVQNGGAVSAGLGRIGSHQRSHGTVTVDGANSNWTINSELNVGYEGMGSLSITDGGVVSNGHGIIGRVDNSIGTAAVVGANSKWTNSGDLNVGLFASGELNITGGGRVSAKNSYIGSGAGSSGTATINGAGSVWTNANELAVGSSGYGALSITDGGVVESTIGHIGRYAGSAGSVLIDGPGSRWNASGAFTMGGLNGGANFLTVRNGGVLSAAGEMTVGTLATLRGDGTIVGNVIAGGGTVAPGTSPGTLHITGNYRHSFNAKLQIELASPASFDKLAVTGNIVLVGGIFGSVLQVSLTDGYVPHGSQSFDILDWGGSLSGTFLSIDLPTLGGTLVWDTSQLYTNGRISVVGAAALAGDYNQNGTVGPEDYNLWKANFGSTENLAADGNGDGRVNSADYTIWRNNLGATLGAGSGAALPSAAPLSPAVPEPTTLVLLIVGMTASFTFRRAAVSGRIARLNFLL